MDVNPLIILVEPVAFAAGIAILRLPDAWLRKQPVLAIAVVAGISAGAAVLSGAAPTGWVLLDWALLAGLGAAAVYAGARPAVPSWLILGAAVVCAIAGLGSLALPLALGAMGLAMTNLLVKADPLVHSVAAGLLVQAALRLSHPGSPGLTALVAAVVLVPLLAVGARTLDARQQRTIRRAFLAAAAFALVGGIGGAIAAASAVGPLRRGLVVAVNTLSSTQADDTGTTARGLEDAGADFAEARRVLDAWWARPARAVPVVAQHWRVLRAAALTGDQLAQAGNSALTAPALSEVRVIDGQVALDQLAAIEKPVADVAARATAARRRLDAARSDWLVPPLRTRLETQLGRIRGIEKTTQLASRVLPMVPRLLGQDGPRRYFLALQTPVESRAGGGFLGSFGEITADNGRVTLTRIGRSGDLTTAEGREKRTLDAPDDFRGRYARFQPEEVWANVNLSPDFPTDARVIASLYPQSGGEPVDGVIALDPSALAALLSVVGPVEVPSWPTSISAANAVQVLQYDQYLTYDDIAEEGRLQREDFLGQVAQEAWTRLTSGELPSVPQLISAFGPAVRGKHLLLASVRLDEQRLFEEMGVSGKMAPVDGDFLGVVTQNAIANKIDYFLRRDVDYRVQLDPSSGRLQGLLRLALHNEAPGEGLPHGLIGNDLDPPLPRGSNKLYLSVYTPWELAGASVDGAGLEFERATELGRKVYSTTVVIPPKSTVVVELGLRGRLTEGESYRLDVFRQNLPAADNLTTTLTLAPGWVTHAGAREQTTTQPLETDLVIETRVRRR